MNEMKCSNGCDAWGAPPSKVICKNCQHIITFKLQALASGNVHLYDAVAWPKYPGNLRLEDLPLWKEQ